MIFTGVDLETSGDSHEESVPIQIGIAIPNGESFGTLIGGWNWTEPHSQWNEVAAGIHHITKEQLGEAPRSAIADWKASEWLGKRQPDGQIFCMVGWNVAGFDLPFIRHYLPDTAQHFTRRTADLNAICYAMSQPFQASFDRIKRDSKSYAADQIDTPPNWHDAEYDALASLHAFHYLQESIRSGRYWK